MVRGFFSLVRLGSFVAAFLMVAALAYGQGSVTSTLTGSVMDTRPGASFQAPP